MRLNLPVRRPKSFSTYLVQGFPIEHDLTAILHVVFFLFLLLSTSEQRVRRCIPTSTSTQNAARLPGMHRNRPPPTEICHVCRRTLKCKQEPTFHTHQTELVTDEKWCDRICIAAQEVRSSSFQAQWLKAISSFQYPSYIVLGDKVGTICVRMLHEQRPNVFRDFLYLNFSRPIFAHSTSEYVLEKRGIQAKHHAVAWKAFVFHDYNNITKRFVLILCA